MQSSENGLMMNNGPQREEDHERTLEEQQIAKVNQTPSYNFPNKKSLYDH